ncbi:MAG: hypothetical protein U1F68_21040 [Gammaproteobacteria bacterium]
MQTDPEQLIRIVQRLGATMTRRCDGYIVLTGADRVPMELKRVLRQYKPKILPLLPPHKGRADEAE